MMEECDNDNGLIDFSSENDSLIASATSSSTLISGLNDLQSSETQDDAKCFEFLGDMNNEKEVNEAHMGHINGQIEELPQLLETSEPDRKPKNGKCNMRKSLAWDRAFFTSSGVLDAEELTSMIEGAEKGKKHVLPGIEEDISRSTDSFSTLESENMTIESLEADLFQDIRASIQRTSKATNLAFSSTDTRALSSSKKVDPNSRTRLKPKPTSKATSSSIQRSEKTTQPISGLHTIQSVGRIRDSASALPRPPLPISGLHNPNRLSTSTTKMSSLGGYGNHIKIETESTRSTFSGRKGTQPSKLTGLTGPRRAVPKPAPPSKPSATQKNDLTRTSSCDSSTSASSNNSLKIPPRRKTDPPPQTSSKIPSRNKKPAEKSKPTLSAQIKLTNPPSSISPASSIISEWSSESSSSTSTVDRISKSRVSIETNSSCRSIESDAPALLLSSKSDLPRQNIKKDPAPAGTTSRQPSAKPSGLRMPSPKIGFFDGAKSASRTPKGGVQSQSRLPTGLTRTGPATGSPIGISSSKSKTVNAKKMASPSSASVGVEGESKAEENGKSVKDQESLGSIDSFSELSCIDIDFKQQLVEGQKDERVANRTPFTDKNSTFRSESVDISRDLSVDVVEKIAAFASNDIGLKENC